jgi:hypothetical protein
LRTPHRSRRRARRDAATKKVVQEIKGIEGAHGIAFSPEMIVAVARHHVARAADIDVIRVRDEVEKFLGMCLLHELGGSAACRQTRGGQTACGEAPRASANNRKSMVLYSANASRISACPALSPAHQHIEASSAVCTSSVRLFLLNLFRRGRLSNLATREAG